MDYSSQHSPSKLNLDRASKKLEPDEAFYLLNNEIGMNVHAGKGSNMGKKTPTPANYLACDMSLPAGECYNGGRHYSPITNETYKWTYNSNGVHFISRINGDGLCEIVYAGDCLPLSADPAHEITDWRAYLDVSYLCSKVPGGKLKRLIWVDGTDTPIGCLDVEASIATNFFTTPFFNRCEQPCAQLQLCVPQPDGCLKGEWVPFAPEDALLSNKMLNQGFKFMYQNVYYDGRQSEWSDRSSLYYQNAKGCFDNSIGFPRCMKFRIPIGNPNVEKINFAFSDDGGVNYYLYDTIEKYKAYNSSQQYWFERELSETVTGGNYSDSDCSFDFIFCNDNLRTPIDPLQVSREFNPIPRGVQGIIPMPKKTLGFYNYEKGSCPIGQDEVGKFTIGQDCSSVNICRTKNVKVTVRAVIFQPSVNRNVFIYRLGGGQDQPDDPTDTAWFSATHMESLFSSYIFTGYDQKFSGTTRNFIPYIEGTDYAGEMVQWVARPGLKSRKKTGVLSGMGTSKIVAHHQFLIDDGWFYFQEYDFYVPQGTRGYIRLCSHHQTNGIGDNQSTSTQVRGIGDNLNDYTGTTALILSENKNEIYFDTCAGVDLDLQQFFIVEDEFAINVLGALDSTQSAGYSGYITDKNNQPVEGVRLFANGSFQVTTDHNGFYSFYIYNGTAGPRTVDIYAEQNCGEWTVVDSFQVTSDKGVMGTLDHQILSETYLPIVAKVNVTVLDCDNHGIPGMRVAMSGSKHQTTGTDGVAHFKLRNYDTRDRYITAIVMDLGGCFTMNCEGGCNPCMPQNSLLLPLCFTPYPPSLELPMLTHLNTQSIGIGMKGLKPGGRYAFGWVLEGDCGKQSAVNQTIYLDIPKTQASGTLNFCTYHFAANGLQLPSWGNRLKIVRSANLNPFDLQWLVDKIDRTADGKIKLTIQSLNDFNAAYTFKTNTVYKYLQGDRVEFIRNGDGTPFTTVLNYLTISPYNDMVLSGVKDDVNYFNQLLIEDDGRLDGLTIGALIELQSPVAVSKQPPYFEICTTIDIVQVPNGDGTTHGELLYPDGTFDTFDTFLVHRQVGKFAAQFFESKTPSDFWGGPFLDDTGKVHFINKYENERRYGRNISINSPTIFNYFGDFEKTFDAADQGDITAMDLKDGKVGLGISENDNFLFEVSDQLLRVGSDNVIRATTADQFISNPEAKLRGKYGCKYADIGSIFFGDGFATYIDADNDGYIIHNYQVAKEAGVVLTTLNPKNLIESTCSSFFRRRIRDKEKSNSTQSDFLNHYRYSTGINKSNGRLYLTTKTWRQPGFNNAQGIFLRPNDTIIYNPVNDSFEGFASFTPEGYSQLTLNNDSGCAMITFQNSLDYIHPIKADKWNVFYGVHCDWMVGVSLNMYPGKIKIPLAIEIQSDTMFFASSVTTEMAQFKSEIPPVRFKENERKWNAAFLNNINSRGGLFSGENARGYQVNVLLVRDNTFNKGYGTIDNNKREQYSELDGILIKFMTSESSGQTENL